jgi:hypothetical protein
MVIINFVYIEDVSLETCKLVLCAARVNLKKCGNITVTGRGGLSGCKMSRIPHFLDNQITDGVEVVSLMRRQRFTPRKIFWYSFVLEAEKTPRPLSVCKGLGKLKKIELSHRDSNPRPFGL